MRDLTTRLDGRFSGSRSESEVGTLLPRALYENALDDPL